jgi:hypothetical protein
VSAVLEKIAVKNLGRVEYHPGLEAMRKFTRERGEATPDEVWLVEHSPVYTLGQGADEVAMKNGIPVVRSDRGGDITYHGPGQIVLYALIDLARRGIKVKQFVALPSSGGVPRARRARPACTSAAPRSPPSASASLADAATTASRSTWTWTFRLLRRSIRADFPDFRSRKRKISVFEKTEKK